MASASTSMFLLKVLFIFTSISSIALGLKASVPLILEFCVSQAPLWWSTIRSWLKPPYLFVIINGIIIAIAASSRFNQNNSEKDQTVQIRRRPKIPVDQRPVEEYDMKSGWESDLESSDSVYEQIYRGKEVETMILEEKSNVAVEDDRNRDNQFVISKSRWIPRTRADSSEIPLDGLFRPENPAFSFRFDHGKPVKTNPEGGRALRVAKPKQHETLENTWKMIMERKAMTMSRHLKKSETWENNVEASVDSPLMKKSDTFKDQTNYQLPHVQVSSSPTSEKPRKEPSLSQEELNSRVEAFMEKFNDETRFQRQEVINQYVEMVNGES